MESEKLQEMITGMLKHPDYDTEEKVKRLVNDRFKHSAKVYDRLDYSTMTFGLKGSMARKRKDAVIRGIDRVRKECGNFRLNSLEESFVFFETSSFDTYDNVDARGNIILGAAIWILDELMRSEKMHELYKYLPTEAADILDAEIPYDFYHPCYDVDLIRSVEHVIIRRNGGRSITDEGKRDENFDRILAMIDPEKIEKACRTFEEKQWDIIGRAMKLNEFFDERDNQIVQEMRRKMMLDAPVVQTESFEDRDLEIKRLAEKGDTLNDQRSEIEHYLAEHLHMTKRELVKSVGNRYAAEALAGFDIDDPYELCIALIILLDNGSDAPWLMKSGTTLMLYASMMLPWYRDFEDELIDEECDFFGEALYRNHNDWINQEQKPDPLDIYHTRFGDRNIARIIFGMCHGVLPRNMHPFQMERDRLISDGMDENIVNQIVPLSEMVFHHAFQNVADNLGGRPWWLIDEEYLKDSEKPAAEEGGEEAQEITGAEPEADLSEELAKAKKQIKELRKALSELGREAQSDKIKYETELKALRQEHRELADLRDIVFNSGQEETKEKEEEKIQFPYETRKRTVVFGGHDSFLKSIKPLLPDVRFIDVDNYTFNPEVIRNAEVVWVQNNHISHAQYWKILNITRQYGIQLRYFTYSSADKSAIQLAEEDRK